jgi:hypothetical protein
MRKLLLCLTLTAVCGVASTPPSRAAFVTACAFACCERPFTRTTPCNVNGLGTTCGAWMQTHSCA